MAPLDIWVGLGVGTELGAGEAVITSRPGHPPTHDVLSHSTWALGLVVLLDSPGAQRCTSGRRRKRRIRWTQCPKGEGHRPSTLPGRAQGEHEEDSVYPVWEDEPSKSAVLPVPSWATSPGSQWSPSLKGQHQNIGKAGSGTHLCKPFLSPLRPPCLLHQRKTCLQVRGGLASPKAVPPWPQAPCGANQEQGPNQPMS